MPADKPPEDRSDKPARRRGRPARSRDGGSASATRPGMPAAASITGESTLRSPKGKVYRILKTREVDEYEEPAPDSGKRGEKD